jgi:hypothetical protein
VVIAKPAAHRGLGGSWHRREPLSPGRQPRLHLPPDPPTAATVHVRQPFVTMSPKAFERVANQAPDPLAFVETAVRMLTFKRFDPCCHPALRRRVFAGPFAREHRLGIDKGRFLTIQFPCEPI